MKTLSIVVPTYNRVAELTRCVESILPQLKNEHELVISDDGSSDATAEYLASVKAKYPDRFNYVLNGKNRGPSFTRNRGIELATGEYIVLFDSDDYFIGGAIDLIDYTVHKENFPYHHYLFRVSDREDDPTLPKENFEYVAADWFSGKAQGDYIHVLKRKYLIESPFSEEFHSFEILGWLNIFKSTGKQFFIAKTVCIRDRGRPDSINVGYELRNMDKARDQYRRMNRLVEVYQEDYTAFGYTEYKKIIGKNILLGMMLGNYSINHEALVRRLKSGDKLIWGLINYSRLGKPLLWIVRKKNERKYKTEFK